MRSILLALIALLLAAPVMAGTSPPGVNLRWDSCFGDGGVLYRDFACDTNAGSERLVGSFELAADIPIVTALEIYVTVGSASPTLPAWWQFKNTATCRQTSLAFTTSPPVGAVNCEDWGSGQASGGIGAYNIGATGPNRASLGGVAAVPAPGGPLYAGVEYFAFSLTINHSKTVGAGACAGCQEPVVIFLSAIDVVAPGLSLLLNKGANYSGSQWASWQHGYPLNVIQSCAPTPGFPIDPNCPKRLTYFDVVPYSVTPTRTKTWGAVKSLYR